VQGIQGIQGINGPTGPTGPGLSGFSSWTIVESAGVLYFQYGGVSKISFDSSGNIKTLANVTAYATSV
jgi:hypothetical protein